MILRHSPTSPYVRKVSAAAIELGLDGQITRKPTDPWDPQGDLPNDNPLGKVPALILDDGTVLYESALICEYLDSLHDGDKLFPASGAARWNALKLHALGDGVIEAAVLRLIENMRRPKELYWADWEARQNDKIARALDSLEAGAGRIEDGLTIGQITIGCALGYLDFRFPDDDWRAARPRLAAWYEAFSQRPSLRDTVPRAA